MIGHKLGEFSATRQFFGHTPADKKATPATEKKDEAIDLNRSLGFSKLSLEPMPLALVQKPFDEGCSFIFSLPILIPIFLILALCSLSKFFKLIYISNIYSNSKFFNHYFI